MLLFYFGVPISIEILYEVPPPQGYDAWKMGRLPENLDRGYAMALLTMASFIWGMHLAGFRNLARGPDPSAPRDRTLVIPAYLITHFFASSRISQTFRSSAWLRS